MSDIPLITLDNVSKKYSKSLRSTLWYGIKDIASELFISRSDSENNSLRKDEFWALQNISLELRRGEALAFIGDNGAGKSTLLKLIYGLIRPDTGRIVLRGKIGAMIELSAGFDPILTGRENIYLKAALFGYSRNKVNSVFDEIVDFAGVEEFIDTPVQFYSSGMSSRLAFAVTAHLKPDILLVDETLAVGDIDFQRKCINHILKYLSSGGSLILVSHSPYHIQAVCQKGILLNQGRIIFKGTSIETLDKYFQIQLDKLNPAKTFLEDEIVFNRNSLLIEEVVLESLKKKFVQTDEDCRLRVKYEVSEDISNIVWGFSIWTYDNLINIIGNYNLTPQTIQKGKGELSCLIPQIPLCPGTYLLKVAISDSISLQPLALKGWTDTPLVVKIITTPNLLNNSIQSTNQLMKLDVQWSK